MRILIIEDEILNANRLRKMLNNLGYEDIDPLVPKSITESVARLNMTDKPDLIMMDIRLSDGLSFDIFNRVPVECPVIFTTAYDEYAVRAFRVNSIDYLLKPVDSEELESAMKKYILWQKLSNPQPDYEYIGNQMLSKQPLYRQRFLLPVRDGFKYLKVEDISAIFAENKLTHIKMKDASQYTIGHSLDEIEDQLDPLSFFRVNRQVIVHIDGISAIYNHFNAKLKITLKSGLSQEIIISKQRVPLFKNWLNK